MRRRLRKRKCRCCGRWFLPQPHNAYHQRYCTKSFCQRASHNRSRQKWLRKNRDYDGGPSNVRRVRAWRRSHGHYGTRRAHTRTLVITLRIRLPRLRSRRKRRIRLRTEDKNNGALQDLSLPHPPDFHCVASNLNTALRDFIGVSRSNRFQWRLGRRTTVLNAARRRSPR